MLVSVGQKSSIGGGKLSMDPECRTYVQVALKISSVWSEVVVLSKSKGEVWSTPLTWCTNICFKTNYVLNSKTKHDLFRGVQKNEHCVLNGGLKPISKM